MGILRRRKKSIRGAHPQLVSYDEARQQVAPEPEGSAYWQRVTMPLLDTGLSHATHKRLDRARNGYGGFHPNARPIMRRHLGWHGLFH